MEIINLSIIGFIVVFAILSLWWAFNTIRRIDIQKNFCAQSLSNIAKLWRRSKFVPEDAKERESLYLYRDFLHKFEDSDCKYPIMVKNGGVRVMTRQEYDSMSGLKNRRPFSGLITLVSILVAGFALGYNIIVTKSIWLGVGLASIMPVLQLLLALFIMSANKDKNNYRDAIFLALKENSVNFLSITKPFIIVDAYPEKFGKEGEALYVVKGNISDEQIEATRNYIVRQKKAETKVVVRNVSEMEEEEEFEEDEPEVVEAVTPEPKVEVESNQKDTKITEPAIKPKTKEKDPNRLTMSEKEALASKLINDTLFADIDRAVKQEKQAAEKPAEIEEIKSSATISKDFDEILTDIEEPAEDDFSLEAIGQALDAEIAKRNKKK